MTAGRLRFRTLLFCQQDAVRPESVLEILRSYHWRAGGGDVPAALKTDEGNLSQSGQGPTFYTTLLRPSFRNVICRILIWDEPNGEIVVQAPDFMVGAHFVLRPYSILPVTACVKLQPLSGPISVFGPAGSGKTTTLFQVARVLQLLKLPTLYLPNGGLSLCDIIVRLLHQSTWCRPLRSGKLLGTEPDSSVKYLKER